MLTRETQTDWLADLVEEHHERRAFPHRRVGIYGRAFKAGTNLTVGSPATLLANLLEERGFEVEMYDPHIDEGPCPFEEPGVYFVATSHEEFAPDWEFPAGSVVIDPWRMVADRDGVEVERAAVGFGPHILASQSSRAGPASGSSRSAAASAPTPSTSRGGAEITAVDLSEQSIALAQKRARLLGLDDRITFYTADAERLSETVPPKPYDLVYSFGVIHHTPHPERAIDEIRRLYVHEESVLKVMLHHRRSWKVFWILVTEGRGALWKLDELVARNSEAQTGCPVTYTYTQKEAERLLRGFDVVGAEVDFIFPYRVADYIESRYVKSWPFRAMPARAVRWLERQAGWHLCLTAKVANHRGI